MTNVVNLARKMKSLIHANWGVSIFYSATRTSDNDQSVVIKGKGWSNVLQDNILYICEAIQEHNILINMVNLLAFCHWA